VRVGVIINPISGRHGHRPATGADRIARAQALARNLDSNITTRIELTNAPGHAVELARQFVADGMDVVVAWGGDGTINQAAGPLVGSSTALGIVPAGSGNGLARGLGLRGTAEQAFRAALTTPPVAIDIGFLADRHFLNLAGIGFDAAVASTFGHGGRRGAMRYIVGAFQTAWSYQCPNYMVKLNDQTLEGPRFLLTFANGREYGNGIIIAPDASPRDGWLDAIVVDAGAFPLQLWRTRRVFIRRNKPAAGVIRTRVRCADVTGDRLMCHVDGEPFEVNGKAHIRLATAKLLVRGHFI
jgi:YegS/Rv2252/BmrU family lipid kinase